MSNYQEEFEKWFLSLSHDFGKEELVKHTSGAYFYITTREMYNLFCQVRGLESEVSHWKEKHDSMDTLYAELLDIHHELTVREEALENDVAHWKSNHSNMVDRNRLLRSRPDIQRDRLKKDNAKLRSSLQDINNLLVRASFGSCNCLTKTPDPEYHDQTCRYRLIMECSELVKDSLKEGE